MKLSDKQIEKLAQKYKKLHTTPCHICGNVEYNIERQIFSLEPFNPSFVIRGGSGSFPCITFTCSECGYVHIISAIASGIINPKTGDFTDEWKAADA